MLVEGITFSNISTDTGTFILGGGAYGITQVGTLAGAAPELQRLSADGSTWANAVTLNDTPTVLPIVRLPAGQYRVKVNDGSALYIDIVRAD